MIPTPAPPPVVQQERAHPHAVVVEPSLQSLHALLSALSTLGFDVTVADTFETAREALSAEQPTVLITDVRLREYNGLHLVLRGQSTFPDLRSIVTSNVYDPVLQCEAERFGATFVVMPVPRDELLAAICRTVMRVKSPGAASEPIRPPFERRQRTRQPRPAESEESDERRSAAIDRRRDFLEALRMSAR
jgi:DNA-binding NtrC family response regulator